MSQYPTISDNKLQRNCSAKADRNADRHAPGWKRPSRARPELTFDPEHLQASFLITRHAMCAWVGVSIPTAELWARNGTGPRITRCLPDKTPYYRVSDIWAFLLKRDGAKR